MNISHGVMHLFYQWRYFTGKTPWDTNVTPPELVELIEHKHLPPGRALDLGCGTGTNALYLAAHGFEVIGVDYVPRAIEVARRKAQQQNARVEFRTADVLNPGAFAAPFDLILDIGCFHSLAPQARAQYADNLRCWTRPGSRFMLYAFFPRQFFGRTLGVTRAELENLLARDFVLLQYADDEKSAWYRWEHASQAKNAKLE